MLEFLRKQVRNQVELARLLRRIFAYYSPTKLLREHLAEERRQVARARDMQRLIRAQMANIKQELTAR